MQNGRSINFTQFPIDKFVGNKPRENGVTASVTTSPSYIIRYCVWFAYDVKNIQASRIISCLPDNYHNLDDDNVLSLPHSLDVASFWDRKWNMMTSFVMLSYLRTYVSRTNESSYPQHHSRNRVKTVFDAYVQALY